MSDSEAVVTSNLKDFPDEACEPWGVVAMHPDEFSMILQAKRPAVVLEVLTEQAGDLKNPPWSLEDGARRQASREDNAPQPTAAP